MFKNKISALNLKIGATVAAAALITAPAVVPQGSLLPQAEAIPPSGAGPNTPGTSSDVWPKRIKPCERLNYKVSGYPAGELLNIKVDDGMGYSDTSVEGSGVIAQQAIQGDGTARGSVDIPCHIGPGTHWLRFLASTESGLAGGGYLGFTHRSANFTIEGDGGSDSGGGSNDSGGDSSSDDGGSGSTGGGGRSNSGGGGEEVETVVVGGGRRSGGGGGSTVETEIIERGGGGNNSGNRGGNASRDTRSNSGRSGVGTSGKPAKNSLGTGKGDSNKTIENTAGGGGGTTKIVLADEENDRAPFVGMMVGGSILLVGLLGIGAYLLVNRRRSE